MTTITEQITPMSEDEVLAELLAIGSAIGLKTTAWQEGSWTLSVLEIASPFLATLINTATVITRGGFGDLLSSDAWATIWAYSRFNVTRTAAEAATGLVTFTNSSVTVYTKTPGEITIAHTTSGLTYYNRDAVVIPASSSIAGVPIVAWIAGTASNGAPGTITRMVTSLTGVTVTNPASVLGTDEETTAALIPRARTKLDALSPLGPKGVYDYIAKTRYFPDGTACCLTSAPITRTKTNASVTTGSISLVLATAAGAPTVADVAIVQAAIEKWAEPWCDDATASAAVEVTVNVTYTVYLRGSSATEAVVKANIATALTSYFPTIPLGGEVIAPDTGAVYVKSLEQAISPANTGTTRVDVSGSNTAMSSLQVAKLGTITGTVVFL